MLLELRKINTFYGISHILFDVSMEISTGELVCILGRNGVGKTTTLRSIMGLTRPRSGSIQFRGTEIIGKETFQIARMGIGFVPENRIVFPDLTVRENLEMGIKGKNAGRWTFEHIFEMFSTLEMRQKQEGGTLSGGEQQMLSIARTLMANPVLLLLDEPSEGLAPLIIKELEIQLLRVKEEGMPIFLSEQNFNFTMKLSDRAYIIEKGRVRWAGECSELKSNSEIIKKFLGI
jgi:branched-chain amino acid transport system ATP-binding protein